MRRIFVFLPAFVFLLSGQSTSQSVIGVRVEPEAHLTPASAPLLFHVTPGAEAVSDPVQVTAWVRAAAGANIYLNARAIRLTGPNGDVPLSALAWDGSMSSAKGGATAATCLSGSFEGGPYQPLISGWTTSGIANCGFAFRLRSDSGWPAGDYTGVVNLELAAR